MIIMKKAIPRRTFLRGAHAALALPLLDAMIPAATAWAKTPARPVPIRALKRCAPLADHTAAKPGGPAGSGPPPKSITALDESPAITISPPSPRATPRA